MTTPEISPADSASSKEPAEPREQRLHRPDPERSGPIRNATGYFRESQSWGQEEHPAWREPVEVLDDIVAHGVKLGYRVIDEHIRHGRRTAEAIHGPQDAQQQNSDQTVDHLLERIQALYHDFGSVCLDALDLIARSQKLRRWLAPGETGQESPAGSGSASPLTAPATGVAIAIEVTSPRKVLVSLNLPPDSGTYLPAVHALHAADPAFPTLTALTFRTDATGERPILTIEVPEHQPAGTYSGVVVDRASNEPKGTLSVRIYS